MSRKLFEKPPECLENIIEECLRVVGIDNIEKGRAKLLLRLFASGIAYYYFHNPDDLVRVGFLQFGKSPDKDELFKVTILRNQEQGIINADTLWRYYTGELHQEAKFKEILDNFLEDLISYSQSQEISITQLTSKLQKRKGETNHGI